MKQATSTKKWPSIKKTFQTWQTPPQMQHFSPSLSRKYAFTRGQTIYLGSFENGVAKQTLWNFQRQGEMLVQNSIPIIVIKIKSKDIRENPSNTRTFVRDLVPRSLKTKTEKQIDPL